MTRIYFAGSIRGGRKMADRYRELINLLQSHGKVYTEHVGDDERIKSEFKSLSDKKIHDRDLEWIRKSDLVVAEVSVPSLGVGYEIARASELGKPVLCLYNTSSEHLLSAMISGSGGVKVISYDSIQEAKNIVDGYIRDLRS